jgi:hypothetical protein
MIYNFNEHCHNLTNDNWPTLLRKDLRRFQDCLDMIVFGIDKGLDNDASSRIKSKESEGGQFEDETSLSSRKITPSLAHSITPFVVPFPMEKEQSYSSSNGNL